MGNAPRLVYSPRPDATPETELSVLAACYRYLLDAHANTHANKNPAAGPSERGNNHGATKEASADAHIIPKGT